MKFKKLLLALMVSSLLVPSFIFGQAKFLKNTYSLGYAFANWDVEKLHPTFATVDSCVFKVWRKLGGDEWNLSMYDALGILMFNVDSTGNASMLGFKLGTSITANYILTTDASGNGTWQSSNASVDSAWNSITLGNDAENVSGQINLIASDNKQGTAAINTSDQLVFGGFSGGYTFDEDIAMLTGKTLIAETFKAVDGDGITITDDGDVVNVNFLDGGDSDFSGQYALDLQNITDLGGGGVSYSFDGVDDKITFADDDDFDFGTGDFSIVISGVSPTSVSGTQYLINKEAGGVGYGLYIDDDDLYIRFDDNNADASGIIGTAVFTADKLHDIAVTVDRDGDATAYINGVLVGTVDISGTNLTLSNAGDLLIGSTTAGADFYGGQISWWEPYSLVLTAAKVEAIYSGAETEYKYVGASQTLIMDEDLSAATDWTLNGTAAISGGTLNLTGDGSTGNWGIYDDISPAGIFGKSYAVTYTITANTLVGNGEMETGILSAGEIAPSPTSLSTGVGTHTTVFICDRTGARNRFVFRLAAGNSSGSISIDNVSIRQIGNVAKYRAKDMTPGTWHDASGNGNDGTVSGATLINAQESGYFKQRIELGNSTDYYTVEIADDGAVTHTTVDVDAAEAHIVLMPDGNVGINETAPDSTLEIDGSLHVTGNARIEGNLTAQRISVNSASDVAYITENIDPIIYKSYFGGSYPFDNGGNLIIQPRTSTANPRDIVFATGTGTPSTRVVILSGGNVGVNETAPDSTLEIKGSLHVTGNALVDGKIGIGLAPTVNMLGISVEAGLLTLKETTTPTADAGYGKFYTKTDNVPYFQDGDGTEHILGIGSSDYGEMGNVFGSSATEALGDANLHAMYHANITGASPHLNSGFTFVAGSNGIIASSNLDVGGTVTFTNIAHGLLVGDIVTLNTMSNATYDGIYEVQSKTDNTFTINETNTTVSESGTWQMGSYLLVATTGTYRGAWNASFSQSLNNTQTSIIAPYVDLVQGTKAVAERLLANNSDVGAIGGNGLMYFTAGNRIWFAVQSTAAQTLTFVVRNISIH